MTRMSALTPKQEKFAKLVTVDGLTAAEAYRRSYDAGAMRPASIHRKAHELMTNVKVAARVAELRETAKTATGWDVRKVLEKLTDIVVADPAELCRPRRGACRVCHGVDHEFQWIDEREWMRAVVEAGKADRAPPDSAGGFGYDPRAVPAVGCPGCAGDGLLDVFVADVVRLSGPARALYAGVKTTRDGVEIKMHNQQQALETIAKIIGAFAPNRLEVSGPDGAPIDTATVVQLDAQSATDLYRRLIGART